MKYAAIGAPLQAYFSTVYYIFLKSGFIDDILIEHSYSSTYIDYLEVQPMKGRKLAGAVIAIYVILLVICSASWAWQLSFDKVAATVTKSVVFDEGTIKKDVTQLTLVLHEGETEKLNELAALTTADLRGSDCTDEIIAWAQAHPDVTVKYDVLMPDGTRVDNLAQTLDLSAATEDTVNDYLAQTDKLPNITDIDLGSNAYSAATLQALINDHPNFNFSYSFPVGDIICSPDTTSLDLTDVTADTLATIIDYLPCMTGVADIKLGDESTTALTWDDIAQLASACPDAQIDYSFTLYGKDFTLADETIDLSKTQIDDNGDAVMAALPALYRCKTLDMDDCGVVTGLPNERMQQIREAAPNIDVVWRIWFGTLYSVRTDTEKILASKPSVGGILYDEEVDKLKYCTKAKYVDLGHNELIYSIDFVSSMPDLEVFIIAMNPVSDITPLANCHKLEYLEIFSTNVYDVSALSELTSLRHLKISYLPNLTDISPLYSLTELERLWIGDNTPIPADQIAQMQQCAPNCEISTASDAEFGYTWAYSWYDENNATYHWVERYEKLRRQLGYYYSQYSFYWLDPKCELPAPAEYAGEYYYVDLDS